MDKSSYNSVCQFTHSENNSFERICQHLKCRLIPSDLNDCYLEQSLFFFLKSFYGKFDSPRLRTFSKSRIIPRGFSRRIFVINRFLKKISDCDCLICFEIGLCSNTPISPYLKFFFCFWCNSKTPIFKVYFLLLMQFQIFVRKYFVSSYFFLILEFYVGILPTKINLDQFFGLKEWPASKIPSICH